MIQTVEACRALTERAPQTAAITALLDTVDTAHGGTLVFEGQDGVGKSALLDRAADEGKNRGVRVLRAAARELESTYQWALITALLRDTTLPLASPSGEIFDAADVAIGSTLDREPLLVLLDDVHWADRESLRFVDHLAALAPGRALAMILATEPSEKLRNECVAVGSAGAGDVRLLTVPPLSEAGTQQLLTLLAPGYAHDLASVAHAHRASGGLPGDLHDHLGLMDASAPAARTIAALPVPERVLARVRVGLGRLDSEAAKLLVAAYAVLADDATFERAAEVSELDPPAAAAALDSLVHVGLLKATDGHGLRSLLRARATYQAIPPGRRALMHAGAARLLHEEGASDAVVIRHLRQGVRVRAPWAVDVLRAASVMARQQGDLSEAIAQLRAALAAAPDHSTRAEVALALADLESECGFTTEAITHVELAHRSSDEPAHKAKSLFTLSQLFHRCGRHPEAVAAYRQSAQLSAALRPDRLLEAEAAWIFSTFYMGKVSPESVIALDAIAEQYKDVTALAVSQRESLSMAALCSVLAMAPAARGANLAAMALHGGALVQRGASVSSGVAVLALLFAERFAEASAVATDLVDKAHSKGSRPEIAEAALLRALIDHRTGDIKAAQEQATIAVRGADQGLRGLVPIARGVLALALLDQGEIRQVEKMLKMEDQSRDTARASGLLAWSLIARGRLLLEHQSNPVAALDAFEAAGAALGRQYAWNPAVFSWRSWAARAAWAMGDPELARELIAHELELARLHEVPVATASALRVHASFLRADEAKMFLDEAAHLLEGGAAQLELAEVLCDLGTAQRELGDLRGSRENIRRALDIAHHRGAAPLENRARRELVLSGGRPRRAAASGPQSLTPTERRVAHRVADGGSDKEVADELFLAPGTVNWHLRQIYRKLRINSRTELGALVHQLE